ncbi:g9143 [Coccomyxa elongata]
MISAQTSEGKKARKLVLLLKKILQDYIVAEQAIETSREAARANALQIQLDGLRAQQQHLYCFKLFGNRYKCGIGLDVDRRIRQHKTTCPSGYLVCSVPITCKAMEKLFESVMKEHGAWIRMEEYELAGEESEIKSIFAVFARTEELLNTTPLDQYDALLALLDTSLGTAAIVHMDMPVHPTQAPALPSAPSSAASTPRNRDAERHVSSAEQTEPQGPLPDLSKNQLRSYIRSHCVRGGDRSVGTVRFRSALALHFPTASCRPGHVTQMMTEEGFKVGTARPDGGKHTSSFNGIGLVTP